MAANINAVFPLATQAANPAVATTNITIPAGSIPSYVGVSDATGDLDLCFGLAEGIYRYLSNLDTTGAAGSEFVSSSRSQRIVDSNVISVTYTLQFDLGWSVDNLNVDA